MQPSSKKRKLLAAGAMLLGVAAIVPQAVGEPAELPKRKAGLWQLTTTMDEGAGPRETAFKMCIDATMENNTVQTSMAEHRSNCATYDIKVEAGITTVNADCVFNTSNVQSHTEMKGDFQESFDIAIDSTTIARQGTQTRPIKRSIKQTGKYLGEACGDIGPGEAMTPDGNKFAVQ